MSKLFKNLIFPVLAILFLASFSSVADAQVLPTVEFEKTPLFSEVKFVPGDFITRFVKVRNNTTETHRVILRTVSVVNNGSLGSAIKLVIKNGDTVLYDNNFSDLFSKSEIVLSQVAPGTETTFDLIATFKPESGDEYQNSTMGFNLQVGFEDGDVTTDTTVAIGGSQGGGGGGGNGPIVVGQKNLIISDEASNSTNPPVPTNVIISWITNMPATSQVIYGLTQNGPYNLDLTKLNFGYPSMTVEDSAKNTTHSVLLSDLVPNQIYSFRVVSRASPPTVSYEHTFVIDQNGNIYNVNANDFSPILALANEVGGINDIVNELIEKSTRDVNLNANQFRADSKSAEELGGSGSTTANLSSTTDNSNQLATSIFGVDFQSWKIFIWGLIVLILVGLILFFFRRYNNRVDKED